MLLSGLNSNQDPGRCRNPPIKIESRGSRVPTYPRCIVIFRCIPVRYGTYFLSGLYTVGTGTMVPAYDALSLVSLPYFFMLLTWCFGSSFVLYGIAPFLRIWI